MAAPSYQPERVSWRELQQRFDGPGRHFAGAHSEHLSRRTRTVITAAGFEIDRNGAAMSAEGRWEMFGRWCHEAVT